MPGNILMLALTDLLHFLWGKIAIKIDSILDFKAYYVVSIPSSTLNTLNPIFPI